MIRHTEKDLESIANEVVSQRIKYVDAFRDGLDMLAESMYGNEEKNKKANVAANLIYNTLVARQLSSGLRIYDNDTRDPRYVETTLENYEGYGSLESAVRYLHDKLRDYGIIIEPNIESNGKYARIKIPVDKVPEIIEKDKIYDIAYKVGYEGRESADMPHFIELDDKIYAFDDDDDNWEIWKNGWGEGVSDREDNEQGERADYEREKEIYGDPNEDHL
jgi:hypothetical protein